MYKCPNCGGEMEFLPERGIIKCEYCGSEFSPEDVPDSEAASSGKASQSNLNKNRKNAEEHSMDEGKVYTCSQCGAELFTTEETGVTFCSYCGSQAFIESRIRGDEGIFPDMIVPFKISKEKCVEIYKERIKSAWFLPKKMKADTAIDHFRGIYMPCWIYSGEADAAGEYTTTKTTNQGRYDLVETFKTYADAHGVYGGMIEDASSSFPDGIMENISPFPLDSAKDFNDKYMTGFYADIGNVPPAVYEEEVNSFLDASIKNDLCNDSRIKSSHVSNSEINNKTDISGKVTDVRKGFIPVWFLSNKNEITGMMSYAVVNGLTGKIHTDLPIDMKKYLILSLVIAVPIFIVLQLLMGLQSFSIKPGTLVIITMIISCILMFFSTKMIKEKYIQEHGLDDEGLIYLKNKDNFNSANDNSGYSKEPTRKANVKAKPSVGKILMGLLCFIVIPVASLIISRSIFVYGVVAGIVVYVITSVGGSKTGGSGSSAGTFEPRAKRIRIPFYMFLRSVMLPIIGVLVGLVVTVMNPPEDIYYYGVAVFCCITIILTVLDFVRATNRLSLRKPAQLGKRGGEEDV